MIHLLGLFSKMQNHHFKHYSDSSTTKLKAELAQLNAETKTKSEKLKFFQDNDEDISEEERQILKSELKSLTDEEAWLQKECEASKKFTPEYLEKLDKDKVNQKESAARNFCSENLC